MSIDCSQFYTLIELKNAPQVVNALLTQMDKLKSSPNVIILTTSNITAAIGKPMTHFILISLEYIEKSTVSEYID